MTNSKHITTAATLIADIDPALARAFVSKPFHRHMLMTAFHSSLSNSQYAHIADDIVVFVRSCIDRHNEMARSSAA